ncbi:MAG: hypothetical protein UHS49_02150 [Faecalimonas sp.]|nr:hypothetical protein [Faecalimonas sp.]
MLMKEKISDWCSKHPIWSKGLSVLLIAYVLYRLGYAVGTGIAHLG